MEYEILNFLVAGKNFKIFWNLENLGELQFFQEVETKTRIHKQTQRKENTTNLWNLKPILIRNLEYWLGDVTRSLDYLVDLQFNQGTVTKSRRTNQILRKGNFTTCGTLSPS